MQWTNRFNLPAPIEKAVKNDTYNPGKSDVTVTRLVLPPRIAVLQERYREQVIEDVSDGFFRMLGKTVHKLLEEYDPDGIVEKRLFSAERLQGLVLSGQLDRYDPSTRTIQDYKFTTCYSAQNGAKSEWIWQLNFLALLARENGLAVENLELILLLRDYSKTQGEKNANYPSSPVLRVPVQLFPEEEIEWYLNSRLKNYITAQRILPECSIEERWARPDMFAVMKKEGKRALRVFDTEDEAHSYCATCPADTVVQKRPGSSIRCELYCPVNQYCSQWQDLANQSIAEK